MSKTTKTTQQGAYQIFEDILMLAGSFAKLGKTIASNKIHSTAETATNYVSSKVELPDLSAQFSGAKESFDSISDYAVHTDVKHMIDDVGSFARKHPVTALISVVAFGAMFSRLMRAEPTIGKTVTKSSPKASKQKTKSVKAGTKSRRKANGATRAHA
jgi:hypothetical protein